MKKHIVYIRTEYGISTLTAGGSVSHTLGVLNGFKKYGYDVTVCSSAMLPVLCQLRGIVLHQLIFPKLFLLCGHKINCIISNIFFSFAVLRVLKKNKSITCIYQRYSLLSLVGVIMSMLKRVPLILEFNGSEVWIDEHWAKTKKIHMRWVIRFFEWLNIRFAYRIVVVSDQLKKFLVVRGIEVQKIIVNPNGVDPLFFDSSMVCSNNVRTHFNIAQKQFVFGFIGTFSYWHGIELLTYLIQSLEYRDAGIHFFLIGDGPLHEPMKHMFKHSNTVTFTGTILPGDAPTYLAACDAFLLPTQSNPDNTSFFGSPTKLFEYMSMARPILASRVGQIEDILYPYCSVGDTSIERACGVCIEPGDNNAFVRGAQWLMSLSQQKRNRMGINAREKVMQYYTWDAHVHTIISHIPFDWHNI